LKHCIDNISSAKKVKNTVLGYGKNTSDYLDISKKHLYQEWINAKKIYLNKNTYTLTEIISSHFVHDDPAMKFMNEYQNKSDKYYCKFLDNRVHSIMQFTILDYGDDKETKEVIIGWHDYGNGDCFLSSKKQVVNFFEKYFDYYYNGSENLLSQKTPSIIQTRIEEKCYHGLVPGIWLYILYNQNDSNFNMDKELKNAIGIISIMNTGDDRISNKYMAHTKVYYQGMEPRGTWHSTNFEFKPFEQTVHIQYEMEINKKTLKDEKENRDKYVGFLDFPVKDNIEEAIDGIFWDVKRNTKLGDIKLKAYMDSGIIAQKDIDELSESEIIIAFKKTYGVDVMDKSCDFLTCKLPNHKH
jgi:hypothetical protein